MIKEWTIEQIREFAKKDYQSVSARMVKCLLAHFDELPKPEQTPTHGKGMWRTGYTLITDSTKNWSKAMFDANNEIENTMVFENFNEEDQGRSRTLICTCATKQQAEITVRLHNEILHSIQKRIISLNEADAAFCKDRWNTTLPDFQRATAREMSNQVTFARQVLQEFLPKK